MAHFKKGSKVKISCYQKGCEGVSMTVTLGEEERIHPSFVQGGGVGRFQWSPNTVAKLFNLGESLGGSGYLNCPHCRTLFGNVTIVSSGRFKKATIFGYDPEPA
ncbi:MAG TPA: hypothetical protein VMD74_02395 [Candidatus Methylomirabilis sp.]|nr:hypothetical protein [Candidatus Methylomirabilis sp.]